MLDLIKEDTKVINIYGISGIGKKSLSLEAAFYIRERDKFKAGVFSIDLKNVRKDSELQLKAF